MSNTSLTAHIDGETLGWAQEMLAAYRARVACPTELTTAARASPRPNLNASAIYEFIRQRRSVRHFEEQELRVHDLSHAIEFMRCAPTSCHRQAVKAFLSVTPETARRAHALCVGRSGFGDFIPAFVSIAADLNAYSFPDEAFLPFVDAGICAAFFLLGCHANNLAATLMAWSVSDEDRDRKLHELLSIPAYYAVAVNCVVGVPKSVAPPNPRKPLDHWFSVV
ncbi:MAG: nitroreductase family protein [Thermogutta sp.]|nr:nitroreductase family protein [Thermogutta sp.]